MLARRMKPHRIVRVHPFADLITGLESFRLTAWHSMEGDPSSFLLRKVFGQRLYPVTLTHHTISYGSMLHGWFLPLMLADTYACDAVICTSNAARQAILKVMDYVKDQFDGAYGTRLKFRGRCEVIPLGVDTDVFRPRNKATVRARLRFPRDAFVILWLGRISMVDKAALLPLISVFRQLVAGHPRRRLFLMICGTPTHNYGEIVRRYANALGLGRRVVVRETVEPSERHLYLAAADVFVSPVDNIQETFGQTPVEAMACGTPPVVSDWNGYRDTVEHGRTGFLVPTRWIRTDESLRALNVVTADFRISHMAQAESVVVDLRALGAYLQALIVNDSLRAEMGRNARQSVVDHFTWKRTVAGYERLWTELALVARRLKLRTSRHHSRMNYLYPPLTDLFSHYASSLISDGDRLQLTPAGRWVHAGKEALPTFHALAEILQTDLLCDALELLGRPRQPDSLGRAARALARMRRVPVDDARRHVLWLMKYGLAEMVDGGRQR
jgi:glycosyltransferase involved in cell wall biosynthesis